MCQPKPGPRCSSHTRDNYKSKRKALNNAITATKEAEANMSNVEKDPSSTSYQVRQSRSRFEDLLPEITEAQEAEQEALKEWYSSPNGQSYLRTKIANAQTDGEREKSEELLQEAEETRRYQGQALDLVRSTQGNLNSLDEEGTTNLTNLQDEGKQVASEIEEKENEMRAFNTELEEKKKNSQDARAAIDTSTTHMKSQRDALARKVHQAYIDNGVDRRLANHYTLDTVGSTQSGWAYLSENSPDRVPKHENDLTIKTKEGDTATFKAREQLENDDSFQHDLDTLKEAQHEYHNSIPPAQEANRDHHEARVKMDNMIDNRENFVTKRDSLRNKYNVMRAGYGGGTQQVEHYDVPLSQFTKSTYTNPDGGTNAFVYSDSLNKKIPVFSPVESTGKDKRGQFIVTTAGERLYGEDLKSRQLRLLKPENGAKKLF